MAVSRAAIVDRQFLDRVQTMAPAARRTDLDAPVRAGTTLRARDAIALFEAGLTSRHLDLVARDLKTDGQSFYTIGSSGHEANAAVAWALRSDDPAFLHYRSGPFFLARAHKTPGPQGALDVALGLVASADEPIAGGRHKVFGSVPLAIPPQTSTIATQLPKAVGCAVAIDRIARMRGEPDPRIAVTTFGDASVNHSTAVGALNAAGWAAHQNVPVPLLFVCEDNGIGISVRTPTGWVEAQWSGRRHPRYFQADGLDLPAAWDTITEAVHYVRSKRMPAFLHLRTVRLLGHAGSDVEQLYRSREEIEAAEALDPLITQAQLLVSQGWLTPTEVIDLYEDTRTRIVAMGREAVSRPKLTSRDQVMDPLFDHDEAVLDRAIAPAEPTTRAELWKGRLPEAEERPRHLALQLNRALKDLMLAVPEAAIFGEDVARKGGVYHVTAGLNELFGVGRVFNTLLDEQAILGTAIGFGHEGLLPIPEIQYLAYLMNAIDHLRGEAGSMRFFSNRQFSNPMVVRIASLAYQKGFGGHFHNDHGIAALREVPGMLIGCPARGDDAARMLRTMVSAARAHGRVCALMEPIALYMTKDLHQEGDGGWLTAYPEPAERMAVGEVGVYGEGTDVCIATYANGLWMSLRVAERLRAEGIDARVVDLRWMAPLPIEALAPHAAACGRMLVVDECRKSSGIADTVAAEVLERHPSVRVRRLTAPDSYVPLGAAANLVLVQEDDIERELRALLEDA